VTKKRSPEILAYKKEFLSGKVGFLTGKVGFFPKMWVKSDLGFSWVLLLAHIGYF